MIAQSGPKPGGDLIRDHNVPIAAHLDERVQGVVYTYAMFVWCGVFCPQVGEAGGALDRGRAERHRRMASRTSWQISTAIFFSSTLFSWLI